MSHFFKYKASLLIFLMCFVCANSSAYELVSDFSTTVSQVTQGSDAAVNTPAFIRHEYSRRPAFNSEGSMVIEYSSNGFFHLYSVGGNNTLSYMHILDQIGGGVIEPNWHPTDPNLLYALNAYGIGMQLKLYDVRDQRLVNTIDMGTKIRALGGGFANADRAYTGEEGRPSRDGNIWCMAVYGGDSWQMLGMIAYNISQDSVIASREMAEGPDAISTSANGEYCVSIGGYGGSGIRSYPISDNTFSTFSQIHQGPEHVDLALDAAGRDVLVYIDSLNDGHVKVTDLQSGKTVLSFNTWDQAETAPAAHFSGMGYAQPGWAVVSMFGGSPASFYYNKILAVELAENPRIIVLSDALFGSSNDYFAQPQATVNFQLDKVLFSSSSSGEIADYMISLNQSLPVAKSIMDGSGTPTPDPTPDPTPPTGNLSITSNDTVYFEQDGNITINVQTNSVASCRWDYASDVTVHPFDALYQDLTSTDGLSHSFSEFAWNDHTLFVACQSTDGAETSQFIQVVRGVEPTPIVFEITSSDTVYFQQDGDITINVQTSQPAACRWDYSDGNIEYGYDVLYQDMATQDGLLHIFSEFAWNDHALYIVCRDQEGTELNQVISVSRQ